MSMGTQRQFQDMLNDFLPNELLKEEMVKRDYVLNKIKKDDTWVGASGTNGNGGNLIVAFKAAGGSSFAAGELTASNDIAQDIYVRGQVTTQKEVWGSMIFDHRDLMEHNKISEQNFLKLLPDSINDFLDYIKGGVSVNLLNGTSFAKLVADATANDGLMVVDRPDRFVPRQKVTVDDTAGLAPLTGYVASVGGINMETQTILLVTARDGAVPLDFSVAPKTVLGGSKCYNAGFKANGFESLRNLMLSAANGGSVNIYGVAKTAYPYTQSINIDGSGVTATNLLQKIFQGYTKTRLFGKGAPTDILMSYRNFGTAMAIVEASKGAFNVVPNSKSTSQYGWTEISVGSVTNQELKLVGIQEMDDDIIIFMDWRAACFYSHGFFQKRKSPDGIEYFEIRATTGYQYIVDISLFGEIVLDRPSYCGIMYGIDYLPALVA